MTDLTTTQTVPLRLDADGVIRLSRTRVTLDTVAQAFNEGATPEEIAQQYPSLPLADIYSVIAYYLRHTEEVETYLTERRRVSEQVRRRNEERFDPAGLRDRLLARRR